jgi:hypothetical protein
MVFQCDCRVPFLFPMKTQVAELQKENSQLGSSLETITAIREALTKDRAQGGN